MRGTAGFFITKANYDSGDVMFQSKARLVLDVIKRQEDSEPFSEELLAALHTLWADKNVSEKAVARGNEYQLYESSP
jgi:guanine nucleotide-binding protein G(o) subunit alpha